MIRSIYLLGKKVELVYRFGGAELFASGVLLGCTDDFILLEQRADQFGSTPKFHLKVPRSWVLRLREEDRARSRRAASGGG